MSADAEKVLLFEDLSLPFQSRRHGVYRGTLRDGWSGLITKIMYRRYNTKSNTNGAGPGALRLTNLASTLGGAA